MNCEEVGNRELQDMSESDVNVKANLGTPVRKSNIPRPSTSSHINEVSLNDQGFMSPKDSAECGQNGAVTPTKPLRKQLVSRFSKIELDLVRKEISEKESELDNLKNEILTTKTQVQRLEPDYLELRDLHASLFKQKCIKENELHGIKNNEKTMLEDLRKNQELQVRELQLNLDTSVEELKSAHNERIDQLKKSKYEKLEIEKNKLELKLKSLEDDIDNQDLNYEQDLQKLELDFKSQFNEIEKLMKDSSNQVEDDLKFLIEETKEIVESINEVNSKIKVNEELQISKQNELNELKQSNKSKLDNSRDILEKIALLKESILSKTDEISRLELDIDDKNKEIIKNNQELYQEEEIRRKYHNKLQELKGNIRVFCRVRPPLKSEDGNEIIDIQVPDNDEEEQEIEIIDPRMVQSFNSNTINVNNNKKSSNFKFDKVFQMNSTNSEIFDEISQLVQTAIYGYNVCIFAYGQTGSGKTYTMSNPDGMIPRAIDQIFEICSKLNQNNNWNHKIYGEFLEIYNENINDLLDLNNNKKYEIRHDLVNEKTSITELTKIELTSSKMMKDVLRKVYENRSIAETKVNERSSRSHSVYIIRIEGENSKTGEKTSGVLNLIDLAGSERLSNSQVLGDRLKETQSINKSLSCLGDVIYALNDGNNRHIPFRNSKLTYLLQFSLLGDSKTLMFVNISPLIKNYNETINSLRFATKVHNTTIKKK